MNHSLGDKANEIRYLALTEDQFARIATRFKFVYRPGGCEGPVCIAIGMPEELIGKFDQLPMFHNCTNCDRWVENLPECQLVRVEGNSSCDFWEDD